MKRLSVALLTAVACGGNGSTKVPAAPGNVGVTPGDQSAFVTWDAVADATDYFVYYNTADAVLDKSSPRVATNVPSATVGGLRNGVAMEFAVSAHNSAGESDLSPVVGGTPHAGSPLVVTALDPADSAAGVSRNATLSVTFNRAVAANTVTTSGTSACGSSTVQLSSDDFATCVPLGTPHTTVDLTFTVSTLSPLSASTAYKLRVTTGVQESSGEALHAAAVSAFTTSAAMTVTAFAPSGIGASRLPAIAVTFNRQPSTLSAITSGSDCSGTFQLSSDSFATCVPMAFQQPSPNTDPLTMIDHPAAPLAGNTSFQIRIKAGALDEDRVPLDADITSDPFTTLPDLAVTSVMPADGSVEVSPSEPEIGINFNRMVQIASLTTTVSGTACTGSLQLSSDSFSTCTPATIVDGDFQSIGLTPAAPLELGTHYQVRVTSSVLDLDGAPADPFTFGFTTSIPPLTVTSIAPSVSLNPSIVVQFSRAIDPATLVATADCLGTAQLQAASGGACRALTVTMNPGNLSARLTSTQLLDPDTDYVLTLTTGIADPQGRALQSAASQEFTTEDAFQVQFSPSSGVAPINTSVSASFNRAPANLNGGCGGNLFVTNGGTCVALASVTQSGSVFTLHPAGGLWPPGATLTIHALAAVADSSGVPLGSEKTAIFSIQPQLQVLTTDPADDAPDPVARSKMVKLTFNRAPQTSSLTTSTGTACSAAIALSEDDPDFGAGSCVPASGTLAAAVAGDPLSFVFAPAQPLDGSHRYYLRVSAAITDPDGVAMAAPFVMTHGFTTREALSASVTPSGNSVSVAAQPQAVFSTPPANVIGPNGASCTGSTFYLLDGSGGCVAATLHASDDQLTWTLQPASALAFDAQYSVVLTSGIVDADSLPLTNPQTISFHTEVAFAVTSTEPADSATGVALNSAVLVHFNRAGGSGEALTTNTADTSCSGNFQVFAQGSSACVQMTQPPQLTGDTVQLTPVSLAPDTQYFVRVLHAYSDSQGVSMAADYTSQNGFHTKAAVTMAVTPADGSSGVSTGVAIDLVFSRAIDAGTLAACVSTDAFATCAAISSQTPATGATTSAHLILSQELPEGALVRVRVAGSTQDSDGAALGSALISAGFTTSMPDVAGAALSAANLQSLSFTWSTDGSEDHTNLYVSAAGANSFSLAGTGDGSGGTASGLTPLKSYDVRITTVSAAGVESAGVTLTGISTAFTGTEADWLAGQTVAGMNGDLYRLTWSSTSLFAGVSNSDGDSLLNDGDALWIAVDTHVDSSNHGQLRTNTAHTNGGVIWPFRIDYIVQLQQLGAASTSVSIYQATQGTFTALTGYAQYEGAVDEVQVPLSAIGSPSKARFALLAINPSSGYVFSVAPKNPGATDVTAYFASLTSGFDSGTNAFQQSTAAHSLDASVSPTLEYPNLVTMSVLKTGASGPVMIRGSAQPLSYSLGDSVYELKDDGTQGDATAADGVYTGRFNFAASTGLLFFQFDDNGTTEFSSGKDRIRTLSGSAEVVPQVSFNTVWSASNSFTIDFVCNTGGTPGQIAVFRPFTDTITPVTNLGGTFYEATKTYSNQDFINGTAFAFKMQYSDGHFEDNGDHTVDDDIIGYARLQWSAGDSTTY